jgi:hypothetical protein
MRTEAFEPTSAEALFDLPCACQTLRRATRIVTRIYDQELWAFGLRPVVALLLGISAYSTAQLVRERRHSQDLTTSNEARVASLRQMQSQVQSISEKPNAMAAQPAAIPPPAPRVAPWEPGRSMRAVAILRKVARPADDPRWRQMQTKLADQQSQIATTREEASQARKEL